jgi:hypothetical protein
METAESCALGVCHLTVELPPELAKAQGVR